MRFRQRRRSGFGWAAAVLAGLLLAPPPVAAAERFEIRNAFAEPVEDVWQLNANMDLGLRNAALDALQEGIPLTLLLEVEITAERGFLPDKGVATLTQRWSLAYDALSQRYVTTNLNSRAQSTQSTLEEALEDLSRVRGLPLVDAALLRPGRRHEISLRASVEIGGLPDAVKALLFWREWSVSTGWYTWSIRP